MQSSEINFTEVELQIVQDKSLMPLKQKVIHKVREQFTELHDVLKPMTGQVNWQQLLNAEPGKGKISRGENLHGQPYVVLDYPAVFEKEDVFTCRTLFWWGHYYSFNLQAKGRFMQPILEQLHEEKLQHFLLYIGNDFWDYDVAPYGHSKKKFTKAEELLKEKSLQNIADGNGFLKLSKILPLNTNLDMLKNEAVKFCEVFLR